ncbi:MAG TPA: Uma2 family endonuclease [Blastocatellia bacterium]|nr:Uma2 family endonuclease [Blastocatellia bacterium]
MTTKTQATIEDLYHVPENGKAEIVDGELTLMAPTGFWPSRAVGAIYRSLTDHERNTKSGYAFPDNAGFRVSLSNRDSFSPDAAWYTGEPTGMRFPEGAPIFAVEVRSEGDYGLQAESNMAEKRRDYFAAGTLCVWDVDVLSPDAIKSYQAGDPENPIIFRRGERADAGDAVPGWSMPVDDLLPEDE